MPKQLTTQNATITTAAVEVKTLTISGKQVTLAVFRQLREEPLIAEDGTLNGVPWGIVNYHPDKCSDSFFPHWHVVWQHGTELRRARVHHSAPFDEGGRNEDGYPRTRAAHFEPESSSPLLSSLVLAWLNGQSETCPLPPDSFTWRPGVHGHAWWGSGHGFSVLATASETAQAAATARTRLLKAEADTAKAREELTAAQGGDATSWRLTAAELELSSAQGVEEEDRRKGANAHNDLAAEVAVRGLDHAALLDAYHDDVQAEAGRRQSYRDALAAIAELPHLFIAV